MILVVEDNPVTRKLYRMALESAGFSVVEAGSANAARRTARRERPAIVLLDIIVPDAQGFKLARELKDLPELKGVPIIAISGSSAAVKEAKTAGLDFADYLNKPVDSALLVEKVRAHLHGR